MFTKKAKKMNKLERITQDWVWCDHKIVGVGERGVRGIQGNEPGPHTIHFIHTPRLQEGRIWRREASTIWKCSTYESCIRTTHFLGPSLHHRITPNLIKNKRLDELLKDYERERQILRTALKSTLLSVLVHQQKYCEGKALECFVPNHRWKEKMGETKSIFDYVRS